MMSMCTICKAEGEWKYVSLCRYAVGKCCCDCINAWHEAARETEQYENCRDVDRALEYVELVAIAGVAPIAEDLKVVLERRDALAEQMRDMAKKWVKERRYAYSRV